MMPAEVRFSQHELGLRSSMSAQKCYREMDRASMPVDELLRGYYLGENHHPFDENKPLNEWESTD